MHEVTYDKDKTFLLTDEEFFKAVDAWDKGKSFYCIRLKVLLPRFIKYANMPKWEVDSEMFVLKAQNGSWTSVYKRGGIYYQLITGNGSQRLSAPPELQKKETTTHLIPQEEFYREKMYLTSPDHGQSA